MILRRVETAATRSLLDTSKLLDANPTLLRLEELEAWKDIAKKVEQLTIIATPQELTAPPGEGARALDRPRT